MHVSIIGAGIGGLVLARCLQQRGVDISVWERDAAADARHQGGSIDLHPGTGQDALRRAGLLDAFRAVARYEDQGLRVYLKDGSITFDQPAEGDGEKPEIDRGDLRALLLGSVPPETIRWGRSFASARPDGDRMQVEFADGTSVRTDVVVGADGAGSRVRRLISDVVPSYTGITNFELVIPDVDTRHPKVSATVGRGLMIAKGGGRTIYAARNAWGLIRVYVSLRREERGSVETKKSLLEELSGWDARLTEVVAACEPKVRAWSIDVLPPDHRWAPDPRITLIGDAAHLMPPAGEGANLAMLDAVDLADALTSNATVQDAIAGQEQRMMDRSETAALRALKMIGISLT